jgi:antitoxin HigA-1
MWMATGGYEHAGHCAPWTAPEAGAEARGLSAARLALGLGVPSGWITDILNGRRSITADTALRLGRYFGNRAQFWLDLQSQYNIAVVEREHGEEIACFLAGLLLVVEMSGRSC